MKVNYYERNGNSWKLINTEERESGELARSVKHWKEWQRFDKLIGARATIKQDYKGLTYSTISPDKLEKVTYYIEWQ